MSRLGRAFRSVCFLSYIFLAFFSFGTLAHPQGFKDCIYHSGRLKPIDSAVRLKIGDMAPLFTLPSVGGQETNLKIYRNRKNVVLSFIPAAYTPVCSEQWPGYNVVRRYFEDNDTLLIGIATDNIPALHAWTHQMGGVWFPVLSDFWPHGKIAQEYGVLRSDGTAERAVFLIDKKGIIRYISVHDINERPNLEALVRAMEALHGEQKEQGR